MHYPCMSTIAKFRIGNHYIRSIIPPISIHQPIFQMPAQRLEWSAIGASENAILSPAYISNGHVFTAGQVGADIKTGAIPELLEEQCVIAFENLKTVLEASGSSLDKVFKVLLFVSDALFGPTVNSVYVKYFPHRPARSCVVVGFPNAAIKVELEAVAELK